MGSRSAFLFPGQGSQEVGMGQDVYEKCSSARRIFDEAEQALGTPLKQIMFEGPAEELNRTINSQPAILMVSLACLAAAKEHAPTTIDDSHVHFMAGHSLGEYTALAAAGVLDVAETAWLVRERGRLMQEACDQYPGAMAALLGLEEDVVEEVCRETGTQIANVNSPGQIVISGEPCNVKKAVELASARGAKRAIPLRVSGAFHSYLMGSALDGMVKALDSVKFRNPGVPVIANCTGKPLTAACEVKEELIQQLCGCVRWQDSISYMVDAGITSFIEFGPGRVLSGMVKRIADTAQITNVSDVTSAQSLANGLQG
ncbi:MAG: ACP S-malonyltransferase [Dehalococcoidia bacterium]